MKKNSIHIFIVITTALLIMSLKLTAQESYTNQLTIDNLVISKEANITGIDMNVNLKNLNINKNELLIVTPVIVSNDKKNEAELEQFAIIGKLRNKVLERPFFWNGKPNLSMLKEYLVLRKNGTTQSIHYIASTPFEEWQRQAKLVLRSKITGCAECQEELSDMIISNKILNEKFVPDYRYTYVVPEVEEVKTRSESYSAHLNYIVGRWDLLPSFQNNASVLAKVDNIINELKNDKDLNITDFTITGYASPEGTSQSNMLLSQRRAESFAQYLEKKYGYKSNQFTVNWLGEDWNGLKDALLTSNLSNKNDILSIIESESNLDARDARLIALDNGVTYRKLLNELYPPLRRNDYNIAFVSRPFNVEEASEIIKTRPKLLSLNEMFLVANTYPENSKEYYEVFEIAARTFPESSTANINVAVSELRANKVDAALQRLEKLKDTPEAWNLLGVAYVLKGMNQQASEYFKKASERGDVDAAHNTQQLKQFIESE